MTIQHTTGATPLAVSNGNSSRRDIPLTTPSWMTPKQAALYLNFSVSWLAKRRRAGDGPPYVKWGGAVRYSETSLQQWMKSQERTSTSGS
jgi:predicted DNA-binding transcriptional regulator AlpA